MSKKRKRTQRIKRQNEKSKGVDDLSIQKTEETLQGGKLSERPDKSLFVVDVERGQSMYPVSSLAYILTLL